MRDGLKHFFTWNGDGLDWMLAITATAIGVVYGLEYFNLF